jgi:3-oxoacyl-[acyl-carrier protein] reductase
MKTQLMPKRGDFLTLSEDDWADGFVRKFFGAVRLLRAAWPILKQRKGSVVNIAGVGGRTPGAQFAIIGRPSTSSLRRFSPPGEQIV